MGLSPRSRLKVHRIDISLRATPNSQPIKVNFSVRCVERQNDCNSHGRSKRLKVLEASHTTYDRMPEKDRDIRSWKFGFCY
jgi:hypothetical protein